MSWIIPGSRLKASKSWEALVNWYPEYWGNKKFLVVSSFNFLLITWGAYKKIIINIKLRNHIAVQQIPGSVFACTNWANHWESLHSNPSLNYSISKVHNSKCRQGYMPHRTHKKIHSILAGTLPLILRLETGKLHQPKKTKRSINW